MNINHPIGSIVPVVVLPGLLNRKRLLRNRVSLYVIDTLQDCKIRMARVDSDVQITVQVSLHSSLGPRYALHPDCVNFLYDDPNYS